MGAYIVRRLLLIPLTLWGILTINFFIVQVAPGGPVEEVLAKMRGTAVAAADRAGSDSAGDTMGSNGGHPGAYRGRQGLPPEFIDQIKKQFGFDQPIGVRYVKMLSAYLRFDLGQSFFHSKSVVGLVIEKLPVSVSLGLWSTLIIYTVSIPLGIAKAVRDGSRFDVASSSMIIIGTAVPSFLFAILLIIVFAGGRYLHWFPLRGLTSDEWDTFSLFGKIRDYLWHMVLPVMAMSLGGFAGLTMLTKNSFLEEIRKQYVVTARAKGLREIRVLYGHIFRNAMLLVIAGFPAALIGMLFTGSVLIEVIFSLDGIGQLGFESVINRDYPVMFGTLYVFQLIGLILTLISDITYHLVDPRIDFGSR